jgi:putative spermidine/putrescine transport system substrate-binding protein
LETLQKTTGKMILATAFMLLSTTLAAACTLEEVSEEWSELEEKAKNQHSITLYVFKYQDYFRAIADNFEEETGIQVTVVAASAEGTYQKMVAEKGHRGGVDLWLLSAPQVQPAAEESLIYGPIIDLLPNADNIYPFDARYAEGFDHKGYVVPVWRNQAVFAYDSNFVAEPPAALAELERWVKSNPNRFTYSDPAFGGSGQAFVNSVLYWLTGEDPEKYLGAFDQAVVDEQYPKLWAWLRGIGSYVVYAAGNADALGKLSRGEVWIAVTWEEMFLQWRVDERLGESFRIYLPAPGVPGGADFLGVPVNSSKKAAGLLFANYLISKESQCLLTSIVKMRPVRVDVAIPESVAQHMIPKADIERYRLPWPHPDYKREYKAKWAQEVAFR